MGIARIMQCGWYKEVRIKDLDSHAIKALLVSRALLVKIKRDLEIAPTPRLTPKALVAPHAGYIYSGGVAPAAFATLRGSAETIKRVVLIGPAHYVHVPGIASPTVDAFETPLGHVPVDLAALSTLADLEFVVTADGPHVPENCLEVELPFLQSALASFQIVPLVVGDACRMMSPARGDVCGEVRKR
ncbi:MAG: AmmeMemoRadiSam system protein B [Rhodoplanes sp.]